MGLIVSVVLLVGVAAGLVSQAPSLAAWGFLRPARTPVRLAAPPGCDVRDIAGAGVTLRGWHCRAEGRPRGTIVYLHGVADNRGSASGIVRRFTERGLDVIAYDSRAHGESGGDACTYGYFEKIDLRRVLDTIENGPVVLLGTSLGAAVALQAAVGEPRVNGVVAAEVFSDLRTLATERAPRLFPRWAIKRAFRLAEKRAGFEVDAVSPVAAARRLTIPVLLVHGADDVDTRPDHSRRVHEALAGPKQLVLVPGARHNQSLNGQEVWTAMSRWIDELLANVSPSS